MHMKRRAIGFAIGILFLLGSVCTTAVYGAKTKEKKVELRLISTTDLHGQLDSTDYETGKTYAVGGLAKAYTLIQQARKEKQSGNVMTFNIGDSIYDFSTEYIFSTDEMETQPIFQAMNKIGFDAITLGNHDLDYGYDYIVRQLEDADLKDKCVVSNLKEVKSNQYPFEETMLLTKKLKATDGTIVPVKIGIIGEIIPNLSTKTENLTGTLATEDMVENVRKNAAKLKTRGADIVLVLAHSGLGNEKPAPMDANVSYALAQIPQVDVVLCGHMHHNFPNQDTTRPYYNLPGVDKKTGLINGKNVVMASDRGKSIGIVDLTISVDGKSKKIIQRKSEVRNVDKEKTVENNTIRNLYGAWKEKMLAFSKKEIGTIDATKRITNYFGLLEDNAAMQLVNDAKRAYAMRYIATTKKEYAGYPVIASSIYNRYGQNSKDDYVDLSGTIKASELASLQMYNNYLALYTITGKQLKEWLEWSASAYQTLGENTSFSDQTMQRVMQDAQLPSLLAPEWLKDWSNFRIFDGVEYVIDPTSQPRYDKNGNKISNSERIRELTCNGKPVTDTMKFVLASDRITKVTDATRGVEQQAIVKGYNRSQEILSDYIQQLSKVGEIHPVIDNNWRLKLPINSHYVVVTSTEADGLVTQEPWYKRTLFKQEDYTYYEGSFDQLFTVLDREGPGIVATPVTAEKSNQPIKILVSATDASGIRVLQYKKGKFDENSDWSNAIAITQNEMTARESGIYSIFAEDNLGNRRVVQIAIDQIADGVLKMPSCETYTNRMSKITGTALPNMTLVIEAAGKTYETKVEENGTFSYALPSQPSDSTIKLWIRDELGNRSEKRVIRVKRTGPNRPTVSAIANNTDRISGNTKDDDATVIAIIQKGSEPRQVYVADPKIKKRFVASTLYQKNMKVVTTKITQKASGVFQMKIPVLEPNTKVAVYNMDHLNRFSRVRNLVVSDAAPNAPKIKTVTNAEDQVRGTIANPKGTYRIVCMADGAEYEGESDESGAFAVKVGKLKAGAEIEVYAIEEREETEVESYHSRSKVKNFETYLTEYQRIVLSKVKPDTSTLKGEYDPNQTIYLYIDGTVYTVKTDEFGMFTFSYEKTFKAGSKIYAYTRFSSGTIDAASMVLVKK